MKLEIIYEDNSLIVLKKPYGIPSQPDKTGDESILDEIVKKTSYDGVIHRLDRPVGGIMVFAKNKEMAAVLSKQVQEKLFNKTYLAVLCGEITEKGILKDYLIKNQRLNLSRVVNKNDKGSKLAELNYKILDIINNDEYGCLSLAEIDLVTGRHHQIRVQFSNAGVPLWGDKKYNKDFIRGKGYCNIALWAYKLSFNHPDTGKRLEFKLNPDDNFPFNLFNIL